MGTNTAYRVPGVLGRFSVHETLLTKEQGSADTERLQESAEKEVYITKTTSSVDWEVDSIHPSRVASTSALSCTSETLQQIFEEQQV